MENGVWEILCVAMCCWLFGHTLSTLGPLTSCYTCNCQTLSLQLRGS
jgi:hypothetical protein